MVTFLVVLAVLVFVFILICSAFLNDLRIEQRIIKEELAVHFRLLHSISRNVAELLPGEGDEGYDTGDAD